MKIRSPKPQSGFTLVELLITLLILGEIATFTIPKVLTSQQNSSANAKTKETVASIAGAFQQAMLTGNASSSTTVGSLTQYLNYVSADTSGKLIDSVNGEASSACNSSYPCLNLHNGAVLQYSSGDSFGGTSPTNAIWFHVDPDGSYSGATNGSGKAASLFLYYNGRLSDEGNIAAGTANSGRTYTADPGKMPDWFKW